MRQFLIISVALLLGACAQTQVAKEVDARVAQENPRPSHGPLAARGMDLIMNSKTLSAEQKEKFMNLHRDVMRDTFAIQDEISKHKQVLFETLVEVPFNPARVNEVKKRLINLNEKKMQKMFSALDTAQKILGYLSPEERREITRELVEMHQKFPL